MLPNRALSNFDISKAVKDLKISNFRGCFMRDTLPKKPLKDECLVLNLDTSDGLGNHWLCIVKRGKTKVFFDSYALPPPPEVVSYLGKNVYYNTTQVQSNGTYVCGHYVIAVLALTNDSTERTLLRETQLAIDELF